MLEVERRAIKQEIKRLLKKLVTTTISKYMRDREVGSMKPRNFQKLAANCDDTRRDLVLTANGRYMLLEGCPNVSPKFPVVTKEGKQDRALRIHDRKMADKFKMPHPY